MHASRSLAVLLSSFVACASPTSPERVDTAASGITSGTEDATDAAVWIVGKVSGQAGYCSGVVVSPHVVLTAAHCAPAGGTFEIFLGNDYNDAAEKARPENMVAVAEHYRHPDWDRTTNLYDFGVFVTKTAIPRTPAAILREPLTKADRGAAIRVVGFGQTSADDKTIGRRHAAATKIATIDATGLAMEGTPSFCFFDSGGPTFMKRGEREVVVGIHSIMESAKCDGVAWDGRVDVAATFVDGVVAKADPSAPDGGADGGTEEVEAGPLPAQAAPAAEASSGGCAVGGAPRTSGSVVLIALVALALRRRRKNERVTARALS